MDKLEKVRNGLRCHFNCNDHPCEKCQYSVEDGCTEKLAEDALEILEKTCRVKTMCENSMGAWYQCECGASVDKGDVFCRKCGGRLAWEC